MSFEGDYQVLCKNGHEHEIDCYEHPIFEISNAPDDYVVWKCSICGELAAWYNFVDTTNGSYCDCCNEEYIDLAEGCEYCDHGRIDGYIELEIKNPEELCTCKDCGNTHVIKRETKIIPKKGGKLINRVGS